MPIFTSGSHSQALTHIIKPITMYIGLYVQIFYTHSHLDMSSFNMLSRKDKHISYRESQT